MPRIAFAVATSLLIVLMGSCARGAKQAFQELTFIDHENLRYVEGPDTTAFQVSEIKKNINEAAKYGVDGYLLFAKDMMEALLTYDFDVPGIGNIGEQAFAQDSSHRERAGRLRKALREVTDHAEHKGIKLYFHSNQFIFKKDVLNVIKPATWGTAVCPAREATWAVYRGKIDEFFRRFPRVAGLQITGDETQVSVLKCDCEKCRDMTFVERVKRLTNETATAAKKHGKEIQMRTWQRMGELGDPSRMEEGIQDNVSFSIKNTAGDFRIAHGLDRAFLSAAAPNRIVCEFDAWREYTGHNYFPCYMGEAWTSRFQFLHERGIQRIAVRLMWNSNDNPIFDRPWGNFINIYAFLKLAEDPSRSAQDILEAFVEEHYPPSARKAAMDLYNFSMKFQRIMYYSQGQYLGDHSCVQDSDAHNDLKVIQSGGFLKTPGDFDARRTEINKAYTNAIALIDRMGHDVDANWIKDLKDGARVEQYVALSSTDKMEAIFWTNQKASNSTRSAALTELRQRMTERASTWKAWHPASYKTMQPNEMFAPFKP